MKKIYATIVIALLSVNCFSQAPNWEWAKNAGGYDDDFLYGSTTDPYGNVYVTGMFISPIMYISGDTISNSNYPSNCTEMFAIKYDNTGTLVWVKCNHSNPGMFAIGNSVAADSSGNVFVTGNFEDTVLVLDTLTLRNTTGGIFLAKYDLNGNIIWARNPPGSPFYDVGDSVVTDASGNVYVAGKFNSAALVFGSDTLHNLTLSDIFVAKYDTNGNVLWARSAGGTDDDMANGISLDARHNVYVTGNFKSPTLTFGSTTLTNSGKEDMFILKYDANGNPLWAKSATGDSTDISNSLKVDLNGNVYVTGTFQSPSVSFGSSTLTNSGGANTQDMFLVKYDSLGNVLWAKNAVGQSKGKSVTTDAWGYVYEAGSYLNSVVFGSLTLSGTSNSNSYIVKYSPSGTALWGKTILNSEGIANSTDAYGSSFIAGNFMPATITVGSITLTNNSNIGDISDIYVAKLNATLGIEENQDENGICIYPNPFTSTTTITFSEEQKNTNIKVMDVLGREIMNDKLLIINGRTVTLDMSNVAKGIYFVRIENEKKNVVNRKIVVQ